MGRSAPSLRVRANISLVIYNIDPKQALVRWRDEDIDVASTWIRNCLREAEKSASPNGRAIMI